MRVLIFDRDGGGAPRAIRELRRAGFAVDAATGSEEALAATHRHEYACLVLILDDDRAPDPAALDFVAAHRAEGWETPILVVSAGDELDQRLAAFERGADDVVAKPFVVAELVARVVALSRRAPITVAAPSVRIGDLELDTARHEVRRRGERIHLRPKELAVLEVLVRAGGRVVRRRELVEECWDVFHDPRSNIVDTHVAALRRRLGEPELIETVRGVGYRVCLEGARDVPSGARPGDGGTSNDPR